MTALRLTGLRLGLVLLFVVPAAAGLGPTGCMVARLAAGTVLADLGLYQGRVEGWQGNALFHVCFSAGLVLSAVWIFMQGT